MEWSFKRQNFGFLQERISALKCDDNRFVDEINHRKKVGQKR